MRSALLFAILLTIGLGATPTMAAPQQSQDAYAATPRGARARAVLDCSRRAAARNFGMHFIQRRNFLRSCMMDRGFR